MENTQWQKTRLQTAADRPWVLVPRCRCLSVDGNRSTGFKITQNKSRGVVGQSPPGVWFNFSLCDWIKDCKLNYSPRDSITTLLLLLLLVLPAIRLDCNQCSIGNHMHNTKSLVNAFTVHGQVLHDELVNCHSWSQRRWCQCQGGHHFPLHLMPFKRLFVTFNQGRWIHLRALTHWRRRRRTLQMAREFLWLRFLAIR